MDPRIIPRSEHSVSRKQIDPDALKVLYRLHRHGKIAYLVGGGVRDLLLGEQPKDFDVVTDARPGEVKRLFRNAWIIGRRFRLVHVVFGKNVVEVATFRAKAEIMETALLPKKAATEKSRGKQDAVPGTPNKHLLITWENTFGTSEQDARRRDFTINALFYDISTYSLIDYVGGLSDLEGRVIRTIGDPNIRFQEDPVRMMRAVKFAARLGFSLEPRTRAAIRRHAGAIILSAPARVLEEIYRLLGSGKATASFQLLQETGLLPHLIPEVSAHLKRDSASFWAHLEKLDAMVNSAEETVPRPVQMATVLYHLVRGLVLGDVKGVSGLGDEVESIIRPVALRLRMTRADTARMMQMYLAQRRLLRPRGRRFSVPAFVRRGYFSGSFQLFRIHAAAAGGMEQEIRRWSDRIQAVLGEDASQRAVPGARKRRRRRRKTRRRRTQAVS